MIDLETPFKYKIHDSKQLLLNGFEYDNDKYCKEFYIMNHQFKVNVSVSQDSSVDCKVYDLETEDEYTLIHNPNASGLFLEQVLNECEKILIDISKQCFKKKIFQSNQTKFIINKIQELYGIQPEFLWEKHPEFAIFRNPNNGKWFGIVMRIEENKIGLQGTDMIEIMNVKQTTECIESCIDYKSYFPAYHMNKKYWLTIRLDNGLNDYEIIDFIQRSYELIDHKR